MTEDIRAYGTAGDLGYGFFLARRGGSFGLGFTEVVSIRIDPLGRVDVLATANDLSGWTEEQLDAMPTVEQAREQHLAPAFAQAEARLNAEVERRRREGAPAPPARAAVDPATNRFLSDYEGVA